MFPISILFGEYAEGLRAASASPIRVNITADITARITYNRLPGIAAFLNGALPNAIAARGAVMVAERARELVPVDDGELRDAIHIEKEGHGSFSVVAGDPNVFYGHIVEHGGVSTPPQPFLVPALEMSTGEIVADARSMMAGAL